MVLPITGPFSRNFESNTVDLGPPFGAMPMNNRSETWFRQRRPYDKPLPYSCVRRVTHQVSDWAFNQSPRASGGITGTQAFDWPSIGRFSDGGGTYVRDLMDEVVNRARAKVDNMFSDPASTLTNLAESSQSLAMVTDKLEFMVRFAAKWKRGQYRAAVAEVLKAQRFRNRSKERSRRRRLEKLGKAPRRTPVSKSLSSGWIETWFGWLPTIGDIQKSLANLSRDFPIETFSAGSRKEYVLAVADWSHKGYVFARYGVSVKVTNPNLYLASQLGLTNPVYTAFELLPYSWLMAWFGNLEQFFRQFSVYHGTSVEDAWYVQGIRDENFFDRSYIEWSEKPIGRQTCFSFTRSIGIPDVTLKWKGLNRLSVTRGATLTSLLVLRLTDEGARIGGR